VDESTLTDADITTEKDDERRGWISAEADTDTTDADTDTTDADADAGDADQDADADDPSV
jgi:hypothetical protein